MSRVFLDLEQVEQHLNALLPGKRSVVKGDGHRHKFPSAWVQMAIIVMNSASEASAAASWIRVLNMGSLPGASNFNASARVPVGR